MPSSTLQPAAGRRAQVDRGHGGALGVVELAVALGTAGDGAAVPLADKTKEFKFKAALGASPPPLRFAACTRATKSDA